MTTYSIPVDDEIDQRVQTSIRNGYASSISDFGRKALKKYLDDLAVETVLNAQKEPSLAGDLDELAEKL